MCRFMLFKKRLNSKLWFLRYTKIRMNKLEVSIVENAWDTVQNALLMGCLGGKKKRKYPIYKRC